MARRQNRLSAIFSLQKNGPEISGPFFYFAAFTSRTNPIKPLK
jgi:hypothetical protein